MFRQIKKIVAVVLASAITFTSATAFTGTSQTQFDFILQKIEQNSLFTQNTEMSSEQVAEKNAYIEQNPDKLQQVVNDYLKTLDTHSMFLTKSQYEQGFATLTQTSGIGVTVQNQSGKITVIDVEKGSPADNAGFKYGDRITKINDVSIENMEMSKIGEMLRGEAGTQVKITIIRDNQTLDFTLTRAYITPSYVSNYTVEDGIEYIRVEAMGSPSDYNEFEQIWNGLDEKNTKAVILDLRSNGGGLVDVAWKMADLIIETDGTYMGAIRWREDQGGLQKHYSEGTGLPLNKICVLVDENTASAAELLAGVLKETGTAEVVGTTTYGKGQGQYHFDMLSSKYKLIVTCMEMNLPISGCWEGKGITPTVKVSNNNIIDEALSQLPAIDVNSTIKYGDKSEQVHALSGRLYLLGYMDTVQTTFDTNMLSALRQFQTDEGLTAGISAGSKTFEKLETKINELKAIGEGTGDSCYDTALELCKKAAAEPIRYTSLSDGSFKAA